MSKKITDKDLKNAIKLLEANDNNSDRIIGLNPLICKAWINYIKKFNEYGKRCDKAMGIKRRKNANRK